MAVSSGACHTSSPSRMVPRTKNSSGARTSTSYMFRARSTMRATGKGAADVDPGRTVRKSAYRTPSLLRATTCGCRSSSGRALRPRLTGLAPGKKVAEAARRPWTFQASMSRAQ